MFPRFCFSGLETALLGRCKVGVLQERLPAVGPPKQAAFLILWLSPEQLIRPRQRSASEGRGEENRSRGAKKRRYRANCGFGSGQEWNRTAGNGLEAPRDPRHS